MAGVSGSINPVWERNIVAYSGKQVVVTFQFLDEDRNALTLTGYSSANATVFDENEVEVLDLSPTLTTSPGKFIINTTVTDTIPPGRYDWRGSLVDASGDEHVRIVGTFTILS